ncbi:MAG: hypothetical protein ACJAZ1_000096 [Yoonia sp.]
MAFGNGRAFDSAVPSADDRENIATTHELFKMLTQDTCQSLLAANYTLVIDEVLTCCDFFDGLSKHDQDDLFNSGKVYIDNDPRCFKLSL